MKLKRILKWTAIIILLALILWGFIAYWRSTNDCQLNTIAPVNPMKAIRFCEYGSPDVVKLDDVEKPVPKDNQVLIKVRAASLNALDAYMIRDAWLGRLIFGLRKPRDTRLGRDVAGQVEAVGKNVTQFKPGDEVFGICRGALAEYAVLPNEPWSSSRRTFPLSKPPLFRSPDLLRCRACARERFSPGRRS